MYYLCFTFLSKELYCEKRIVCFIIFIHSFNRWLCIQYFLEGQFTCTSSAGKLIFRQTLRSAGLRSWVTGERTAIGAMAVEEWPEEMTLMLKPQWQARWAFFSQRLARRALWRERTARAEIWRWLFTAVVEGGNKPMPSSRWMNSPDT